MHAIEEHDGKFIGGLSERVTGCALADPRYIGLGLPELSGRRCLKRNWNRPELLMSVKHRCGFNIDDDHWNVATGVTCWSAAL